MMKLAKLLAVALFLALLFSACEEDDPGSTPGTAVQFPLSPSSTTLSVGGTRDYYAFFNATGAGHTINLTGQTANFGIYYHANDATFGGSGAVCNIQSDTTDESCPVGPTTPFQSYYLRVHNFSGSYGSVTVTIN